MLNFCYLLHRMIVYDIAVMVCLSSLTFIVILVIELDVLIEVGLCPQAALKRQRPLTEFQPTLPATAIINLCSHCSV